MATETIEHVSQKERDDLVMEIVFELDKIARTLPGLVPLDAEQTLADAQTYFIMRTFGGRMLRLTSILMEIGHELPDRGDYQEMKARVTLEGISQG